MGLNKAYFFCLCMAFCLGITYARSQNITPKLTQLKATNNLQEWLYTRMDYTAGNPQRNLPFLMATQKETWRQPKTPDEQLAWMLLLSNQGYYQLQAGDILSSINCYEDAYSFFYKHKLKDFDLVEYVLKPLSNNYTRLGDYERAIFIQQKAIAQLNPVSDADKMASIYSNMAIAWYDTGNYTQAENCIAKGNKLVQDAQVRFHLLNILGDILFEKQQYTQAASVLQKNIATAKNIDDENAYWLMGSFTTLGKINIKLGKLNEAEQNFGRALNLVNRYYPGGRLREKANLIAQQGIIERIRNQPQKALLLFNQALQILRINTNANQTQTGQIYGENRLVEIFQEKGLAYRLIGQDEAALQNLRYALLATDKMRKEFADNKTKERLQQEAKELAESTIELSLQLFAKTSDVQYTHLVLQIAEQTKARTLADELQKSNGNKGSNANDPDLTKRLEIERAIVYNEKMMMTENNGAIYQRKIDALKFDLALLNKKNRQKAIGSVAPVASILSALPDSLHVLEFFVGNRNAYLIEIKNKKVLQVMKIASADSLKQRVNKLVNTYYRNGPDAMLNAPKVFFLASNNLYNTLFKKIALAKNERLCIVADDVLGYLSFDGLITGSKYDPAISQWPFLIKSTTTTYAFSLNTLIANKTNKTGTGFSGLFITHQNSKPIVAVKKEAAAISQLVKGRYIYDDEVNSASFFKAFESSAVLHIGTHAYLSGANSQPTLDLGKDKLYLFELLAKRQKPALVVLSACRTGDGLLAKSEGIISLARGFSAIGTPATIAGLWNINDDAASKITADFYRLLANGQTSGLALHGAKLKWLQTPKATDAFYLPYYWDSLILLGTDAPVKISSDDNNALAFSVAYCVIVLLLVGMLQKMRSSRPIKFF